MARRNLVVDIHVGPMAQSISTWAKWHNRPIQSSLWFALSHDTERGGGHETHIRTADGTGKPMSPPGQCPRSVRSSDIRFAFSLSTEYETRNDNENDFWIARIVRKITNRLTRLANKARFEFHHAFTSWVLRSPLPSPIVTVTVITYVLHSTIVTN